MYEEYAEQADLWLAGKEAFLANEDLGVSEVRHTGRPNNLTTNESYPVIHGLVPARIAHIEVTLLV